MARFPLTLALILISLTVLVTVITAFRLRDLPKTSQENKKADRKQQKCDNCDLNEIKFGSKSINSKIDSDKRSANIKHVVREKQDIIIEKNSKVKFKIEAVDDENLLETDSSKNIEKEEKATSWLSIFINDDDEDDDDDNDVDDDDYDNDDVENEDNYDVNVVDNDFNDDDNNDDDDKYNDDEDNEDDEDDADDEDDEDDADDEDDENDEDDDEDQHDDNEDGKIDKDEHEQSNKVEVHTRVRHERVEQETNKKTFVSKKSEKDNNKDDNERQNDNFGKLISNGLNKLQSHEQKIYTVDYNKYSAKMLQKKDDKYIKDDKEDDTVNVIRKINIPKSDEKKIKTTDKKFKMQSNKNIAQNNLADDKGALKHKISTKDSKSTTFTSEEKDKQDSKEIKNILKNHKNNNTGDDIEVQIMVNKTVHKSNILDASKISSQVSKVNKKNATTFHVEHDKINKVKTPENPIRKQHTSNVKIDINKLGTSKTISSFLDSEEEIEEIFIPKKKIVPEPKLKVLGRKESKKDSKEVKFKKEDISKEIFSNLVFSPKQKDDIQPEINEVLKQQKRPTVKDTEKVVFTQSNKTDIYHKESKETLQSEEAHLKSSFVHMMDALHRRNMLQSEFEDIYAFLPTFAPNFSLIHNPECRRHGQILLRQLRGTKIWALNMLDATGKLPSGILRGNGIQLGDFDQCLGSKARVQLDTGSVVRVQGKYCLAQFDLKAEHTELEVPVHLAQAKNLVKSRIDDPGHFVPRFSTLSWGVCVPSPCGAEDVEVILKDAIKHYQHTSGIVVKVKVDERDCHTENYDFWGQWLEWPTVLTLSFYAVIIILVLIATLQDSCVDNKNDNSDDKAECDQKGDDEVNVEDKSTGGLLSSFSLYRTIDKLTAPGDADDIPCIHGVRGIATIALLVAHKFVPVGVTPYSNRLKVTETASWPLFSWARAGWVYTDCFLLLSGALTARRTAADTGTPRRLFSKYLRLTPALLAVVLFYAYVWEKVSTGPMWGTLVKRNSEICKEGWWWNLLYVQNYFGFDEMCAPQSHQLALDMQLTIIGGFLVWMAHVKPSSLFYILPSLLLFGGYSRYSSVYEHRLTLLAYNGVSVSQLYRTAKLTYTSAIHRSTPYLVGITLGLVLQRTGKPNKFLAILGWLVCSALWTAVWLAVLDSGSAQYRYSAASAAQFAAIAPISSALAIAWVIYAVHNGTCDFISRLLCCRPLVFVSRLSYALYLTQFVVFLTNAATVRTSKEFTILSLIDVHEIIGITLASVVLTVTLVTPMQSILKTLTLKSHRETKQEERKKPLDPITEETDNELQNHAEEHGQSNDGIKNKKNLIVHREPPEEISEIEMDLAFELQRKDDGLEEILEEEEGDATDEEYQNNIEDEEPEVIEEEGGEDFWAERETYNARRNQLQDQDLEEWEWTSNGNRQNGAQYYRYNR